MPSNAVSGVYIAQLVRDDNGGESQIPFVVRNDASHSEVLLQTSDATWEAYNDYGGNSLYTCTVACPPGEPEAYKAAYAVSYNRPFDGSFAIDGGASYLWYAEYQMIYWLEEERLQRQLHERGRSRPQRRAAEEPQAVHLQRPRRVLVRRPARERRIGARGGRQPRLLQRQRDVLEDALGRRAPKARTRPTARSPPTRRRTSTRPSTPKTRRPGPGAWRDPRFSPPANGGKPENALTGQYFLVNAGTADITVPSQYGKLRMWRNTAASTLNSGQSLTLAPGAGTLGYEWDEDVDNGFRPAGEFDLSSTTVSGLQTFNDYGSNLSEGTTATHHLTLYQAPSGALVFGAGTVQWSWGLANVNAWEARHDRARQQRRPTPTWSRRPSTCSPKWAPSRGR